MATNETRITYVGHGTVLVEMDGVRLLTDPALGRWLGPLLRRGPLPDREHWHHIDSVLVSHLHIDHLDVPSLRRAAPNLPIFVPEHGADLLRHRGFSRVEEVRVGDHFQIGPVEIIATPAKHPGQRYPRGIEGDAVGYLVHGSRTVYFAGDTALFEGMKEIAPRPDIVCLPIDGWGMSASEEHHLGPFSAAEALTLLNPSMAVPIHWGTYSPPGLLHVRSRRAADGTRAFVHCASRLAPSVDVRVLMPGRSASLPSDAPRLDRA